MGRFHSEILDHLDAVVYVADMNTYEILYANKYTLDIFGDIIGKTCWQHLQSKQTGPCLFCSNQKLLAPDGTPAGVYHWEFQNTLNGRWYDVRDRAIRWSHGRIVRLEIATDITELKTTQKELAAAKTEWENTFDAIPEIVMLIDTDYRILRANRTLAEMLGIRRGDLIGKLCYEVIHKSKEPYPSCPHHKSLLDSGPHSAEVFIETLQGHYRMNTAPLLDTEGQVTGSIEIAYNITERKHAESEKDRLLQAIAAVTEGIAITDEEDRFIYSNNAHSGIYGYTQGELIGKTWRDLITPELVPPVEIELSKTLHRRDIGTWSGESPALRKDGSVIPTEVAATSRWDEAGNYLGHICIVRDVTDRKRMEERLRNLIETTSDWIWEIDEHGVYTYVNQKVRDILGYEPEEVMGKTPFDFMPPEEAKRVAGIFKTIIDSCTAFSFLENLNLHKDGKLVFLETSGVPFFDAQGKICGYHGIDRDITERRRAEEEIMKLNRDLQRRASELERAYRDMESFSYAASHDLKAPVIRIAGFSGILLEDYADRLDDYGKECLSRISDNTGKMRQLIEDLLAFSSVSAREIQKSSVDMEFLTRSAYEEIDPAAGRNIQLQITELPSAYGDPSLLRQVLLNLLANAAKFTRSRETARIEVGGRTQNAENIFYVRDNGTGFNMKFADKLFGLFQRIHKGEEYEGTGIGLVIVKRIIEKHGGRVWAEGKPDEGATFYFTLPLRVD